MATKFCQHCGKEIDKEAFVCTHCGCQVGEIRTGTGAPQVVINNANTNTNVNAAGFVGGRLINKWVAFFYVSFWGLLAYINFTKAKSVWVFYISLQADCLESAGL